MLLPGTIVFSILITIGMAAPVAIFGANSYNGAPLYAAAFASRAMGAIYVLWVISVLMAEDAHRAHVTPFSIKGFRSALPFTLGAGVFGAVMFSQVVSLMLQGGGLPIVAPTEITDFLSLVSFAGSVMSTALADVTMFSMLGIFFWPVLLISLGAQWLDVIRMMPMLLSRVPVVMLALFCVTLGLSVAAVNLPLWTGLPLELVWIGWLYVATREIFAGIVKNAAREKVASRELAPSPV